MICGERVGAPFSRAGHSVSPKEKRDSSNIEEINGMEDETEQEEGETNRR